MTAESGVDEFGVRRRVCRTVATEDEAKRLEVKLQHEIYEGQHVKPSTESVASFCARYLEDHRDAIAPTTYARSSDILRAHVVPALGRVSLAGTGLPGHGLAVGGEEGTEQRESRLTPP